MIIDHQLGQMLHSFKRIIPFSWVQQLQCDQALVDAQLLHEGSRNHPSSAFPNPYGPWCTGPGNELTNSRCHWMENQRFVKRSSHQLDTQTFRLLNGFLQRGFLNCKMVQMSVCGTIWGKEQVGFVSFHSSLSQSLAKNSVCRLLNVSWMYLAPEHRDDWHIRLRDWAGAEAGVLHFLSPLSELSKLLFCWLVSQARQRHWGHSLPFLFKQRRPIVSDNSC